MSEPIRTSAATREKLAKALKRNMARRKAGARVEGLGVSETSPMVEMSVHPITHMEASLPLPAGEVGMRLGMTGEGIAPLSPMPSPESRAERLSTSPEGRGKGTASA